LIPVIDVHTHCATRPRDDPFGGTDYGPVPIDPKEHIDIVNSLAISAADKDKILWRNAARFYKLDVAS
jgi:hypothetical protein